jgi:hypothetical protein
MKKFVLLMTLILAAGLVFAQEETAAPVPDVFDLEINMGFPIHWSNSLQEGDNPSQIFEDTTVSANTALGLALLLNFKRIDFVLDTDFFYGARTTGIASNDSDGNSLLGANALLGPVFYLHDGNSLRIPLAIGGHLYYHSEELWVPAVSGPTGGQWIKQQDIQVGFGVYLGIQFHFNDKIYIFSRANVAIDIFRWHKTRGILAGATTNDNVAEMGFISAWGVKPVIGIGVKF